MFLLLIGALFVGAKKVPALKFMKKIKVPFSKPPGAPKNVNLKIVPSADANLGRSFYVVVRSVTDQEFVTDQYDPVANLVFSKEPSPSVLKAFAVVPGRPTSVRVPNDAKKQIAVYCLLTDPGESWKIRFPQPVLRTYKVEVGKSGILQEE